MANTKLVLKIIASVFDVFNFLEPILNRARIFMHKLQRDSSLGWDPESNPDDLRQWKVIAKQVISTPENFVPRFVGKRESEYRLIAFANSSKVIFATVIYIQDLRTNKLCFVIE